MLGKRFHIGKSETKSHISLRVPESEPLPSVKQSFFETPQQYPLFRKLVAP